MKLVASGTRAQADFVHSDAPFPAFVGGYGSGKTHALCLRAIFLLVRDQKDIAYYMPTYDLVRKAAYPRLLQMLQGTGLKVRGVTSPTFSIFTPIGTVHFVTMDNPESIVGYEVGHSLLDELDTLPTAKAELVWQKTLARNRLPLPNDAQNTMAVGTTPEGFRFVYEQWGRDIEEAERKGYVLYRGRTLDNKHLKADYVNNLRNQYPANLLEAYLNGEFVNLNDGLVQRGWFQPSTLDKSSFRFVSMGVDLAISLRESADSSALVVTGLDEHGRVHVLHAASKKGTFNDVQNWIKQQAAIWQPKVILIEAVQYQLAAVQELMRTTRLPVQAVKPDKDKASRLMPLASRYEQKMVLHTPANSNNAIKALEDELTAFPNGAHDDLVDALVYAWQGIAERPVYDFQSSGIKRGADNW